MYKMLVLDFDDTLLTDDLSISDENIEAIKKAKELGVTILFCSGRSDDSMMQFIELMDTHDEHEYFVSFNGARIDRISGENVFLKPVEQSLMSELIDLGYEFNVVTQLYYDSLLVVEEESRESKVYQERTNMDVRVVPDIKSLPYSVKVLFHNDDRSILAAMKERIEEKYSDIVNTFYSKTMYLEVLDKEVNKGLSVKYMAEKLGIDKEDVIAVGDGHNDIYMIEYAGLGIAVQNANDDVKASANYVTKATNNESAIAEVVNKFILNS